MLVLAQGAHSSITCEQVFPVSVPSFGVSSGREGLGGNVEKEFASVLG